MGSLTAGIGDVHRARQARGARPRARESGRRRRRRRGRRARERLRERPEAQARGDGAADVGRVHARPARDRRARAAAPSTRRPRARAGSRPRPRSRLAPASSSPQGTPSFVALKVPAARARPQWRIHVARSRTSMNCVWRSGGPGARISPPRWSRCAQYVNRPVGSCGPAISPGRTISARSRKLLDRLLAERLQRAVVRVSAASSSTGARRARRRGLASVGPVEKSRRPRCSRRRRSGRASRSSSAEARTTAARSRRGRRPHPTRGPRARRGRRPVAAQLLRLREELRVRLAAVEERQLVPARQRGLGDRAAEELRPAEKQEPQWNLCTARQTASAPNSTASTGIRSSAAWISFMKSKSSGSRIGRKP